MQQTEESILPSIFTVAGYKIYFWSNENGEPIPNGTKVCLTKAGGCILANNGSDIPTKELNELLDFVAAQFFLICSEWKKFFLIDEIKF